MPAGNERLKKVDMLRSVEADHHKFGRIMCMAGERYALSVSEADRLIKEGAAQPITKPTADDAGETQE
jgi:hypothetical protein